MRTILVVDDEYLVRVGIHSFLNWEEHGYTIIGEAADGQAALDIIEKAHPDIVLTDLKMDGMDGFALIETCKKKWPDILFVVLSSYDDGAKVDYHFGLAYFNSLKIAFFNVIGAVLTSSLAGYAFAKLKFKGRDVVFLLYLSTMMIPSQITIIPKFVIFDKLGMIGTHATLILPGIFTITGTFLMRQYFMQIPNELRESAKIDGASEFCTWWRIMLPMAKSSMAALAMMVFLWTWNNYLDALVFLPNWRLYTILHFFTPLSLGRE